MIPQSSSRFHRDGATTTAATATLLRPSSMARTPFVVVVVLLYLPYLVICCYICHAFTITTTTTNNNNNKSMQGNFLTKLNHERTTNSKKSLMLFSSSKNANTLNEDDIYVMVNGMPGPMATAAAEACLRKGLQLAPIAMTGPNVESATITVVDPITQRHANVRLISSTNREEMISSLAGIRVALGSPNIYAIDYTHPSAVNGNCKFYIQQNIPFVMGTTGGNRTELYHDVEHMNHDVSTVTIHPNFSCVIAPNMGKQIVAMQAALSELATKYPGAFAGYQLQVTESHQKTKADTSGTAKAVIDSIKVLTSDADYTYDDIQMIRNDEESIQFGIPEDVIRENTGHAYHTYTLTSPDKTVQFQLQHNVIGRTIYAEGTADAVKFLANQVRQQLLVLPNTMDRENDSIVSSVHSHRRVYNMIDVLKEGALE